MLETITVNRELLIEFNRELFFLLSAVWQQVGISEKPNEEGHEKRIRELLGSVQEKRRLINFPRD